MRRLLLIVVLACGGGRPFTCCGHHAEKASRELGPASTQPAADADQAQ